MIDTVRFALRGGQWTTGFVSCEWAESASHGVNIYGSVQGDKVDVATGDEYFSRRFQHIESGLRLLGDRYEAHHLEVSLPRLYYGENGKELRPEDCHSALNRLRDLAAEVAPYVELACLSRVDLVKNFHGKPGDWIAMFRGIPHRRIRNKVREWFGTGLTWPGSYIFVNLYDKRFEIEKVPGDIMRLEFQLRGRECPTAIWTGSEINYRLAYATYRNLAMGFEPRPVVRIGGIAQFLAWLRESQITIAGLRPVDMYLAGKSKRQQYRLEAEMRAAAPAVREVVSFRDLLPENAWPEWVDCLSESDGVVATVSSVA